MQIHFYINVIYITSKCALQKCIIINWYCCFNVRFLYQTGLQQSLGLNSMLVILLGWSLKGWR